MLRKVIFITFSFLNYLGNCQTSSSLEYFIDTDPGLGLGTHVPLPSIDTVDINFNLNVSNLSDGLHTLYIRSINTLGFRSFTQKHIFFKTGDLSNDISQMEYFIDTDPGIGNGTSVSISQGDTIDVSFTVNLMGISPGVHTLYVRSRKTNGLWSLTQAKPFFVYSNTLHPEITALEYFYDIDPGPGNGTAIDINHNDTIDVVAPISLSGLTVGNHKLHVRGKDSNGNWSHIHRKDVSVTATDNMYPAIAVTPALKTLTAINCLTSVVDSFIVTNTGSNPLNVNISETASWMSVSPIAMGVPAGQSRKLYVTGTPSPALPAQSSANITFTTNDPVNPTVTRPVVFNVPTATYTMEVSSDSLFLDTVQVNNISSGLITLTNTSCSSLEIDTILHSNSRFSHTVANSSVPTSLPGYTYLGYYNGHSYFKSNGTSTWLAAESSVIALMSQEGLTGYMVSINNEGENAWLLSVTTDPDIFIGLRDADGPGTNYPCEAASSGNPQLYCWKWSDGTLLESNNYNYWNPGEPNNSGNEDFVHFFGSSNVTSSARGRWNDTSTPSDNHILEVVGGFPSGATQDVSVLFESSDIGTFLDTMIIITQAGSDTIYLSATAVGVPVIALEHDSLLLNFAGCAIDTTLTSRIYNNGNGPLNVQIIENTTTNILSQLALQSSITVGNQNHPGLLGTYFNTTVPLTIDKLGVFDSGMDGISSNIQVGIINRTTNTNVAGPITITGTVGQLAGAYRMVNISPIVLPAGNYAIVAVGFNSSNLNGNVGNGGTPSSLNSFNGVVAYQGEYNSSSTSFSLPTTADGGLLGRYHAGTFAAKLATPQTIPYPSWMAFAFGNNTVLQNDSTTLSINFNSVTLPVGVYDYNIIVSSNDTITPIDTIRLHLNIPGDSSLTMQYLTVNFDTIPRNTSTTFTSNLINNGCTPVYVSATSFGTSVFEENVSTIYLPPYSSYPMVLKFQPPLSGDFQDTLTIVSNVGLQQFPVFGHAAGALTYELSKLASNVNVQDCNGMTMDTIWLYNVGDGEGTWSVANIPQIPSWLMVNPQSGSLMSGDSIAIAIGYDATGLINNTYSHILRINFTDPETPYIDIPSAMFVVGSTLMSFSQDTVDFGLTYFTTVETDTITIFNAGCDTFFVTNVLRDPQFGIDQTSFRVLPDSSQQIIVSFTPGAIGMYADSMRFIGINDTLYLPVLGQGVHYPQFTKAVKDSIVITIPGPIDVTILNTNTWAIWGEQTGKRTGTYSVDGNGIIFIPTQNFFAGEEVSYTLTQNVKYASGENIQPFSDSKNVKVWNVTQGEFVVRPTNKVLAGLPSELYLNDMNSDGKIDFLYTAPNSIGILTNQGNNTFLDPIVSTYSSEVNTLEQIKDFNGDGFNDLVFSSNNYISGKIQVLNNNGSGSFSLGLNYGTGYGARSFLLDFDNDGLLDIISGLKAKLSTFPAKLETYKNNGANSFLLTQSNNWPHNINDYVIADFNNDGYSDFIGIGNQPASTFESWYFNIIKNNKGVFQSNSSGGSQSLSIASKNTFNIFGNNGKEPVFKNSGGTFLVQNNSNNFPQSPTNYAINNTSSNFIIGDIDGDFRNDLIPMASPLKLYRNVSDNNFQQQIAGYNIFKFTNNMADLDNDGDLDFAFLDAQGKLWIAYNEDSNAEIALSQDTISATYTTCTNINTYATNISNAGDSTLVWQINLPNTIPTWMDIDTTYGQIPGNNSANFNVHINTTGLLQGSYSYDLIFNSNAINKVQDTLRIQFTITNDSIVLVSANSLDFGLVDIQVNKTLPITITNPGCAPINLTGSLSDGTAYSFSGAPVIVPAFGSKVVNVTINVANSGFVYLDTITFSHDYGSFMIPLQAQGCYVSPTTNLFEQVCLASEVGIDSTLYQNISGCDSLVVTHYQLPNTVSNEGLVAYYSFNGNANDESGNNLNGNLMNAPLFVDGIVGQSVRLVGQGIEGASGQNVLLPDYNLDQLNQFSISIWVSEEGMTYDQGTGYFSNGSHGGNQILIAHFGNSINFTVGQVGFNTQFSGLNTWVHYALTYSSFDTMSCYRNGILLNKSYSPGGNTISNTGLGRHWWNNGNNTSTRFIGKIDELKIYNRCLSFEEVQNLAQTGNATSTNYTYSQTCAPIDIGLDTTILAGANQYGCDSTTITQTSLQLPVSNEGLVAYYPFSGNANDGSGLGNHGTVNGATLTSDRYGNVNGAYSFDGNDWVRNNNTAATNVGNGNFTVSAWIKRTSTGIATNSLQPIFGKQENSGNYRGYLLRFLQDDRLEFITNFAQWYGNGNVISTSTIVDTNWHHIVCQLNGTEGKVKIYKDGQLIGSASGVNTYNLDTNTELYLGKQGNENQYFFGKIDQFLLIKRALSDDEIQSLFLSQSFVNTCIPDDVGLDTLSLTNICGQDSLVQQITSLQTPVSPEKLVAYYPMTGNANDMSGWGNHATVNGATPTLDRFGNPNGAYSFDGNDDNIQITNPPRNYNKELTVSWWVNASDFKAGGIGQGTANVDNMSTNVWLMHGNNTAMSWYVNDNGTWRYTSTSIPITNGWVHIVGTASADSIRLYINGVKTLTGAGISNQILYNPNSVIHLGKDVRFSISNRHMVGLIDEVQVFTRALNLSEIQTLNTNSNTNYTFNYFQSCDTSAIGIDTTIYAGAAQNGCDSLAINHTSLTQPVSNEGLQAYYTFDGNADDMSGYDRHGLVTGATLTTDQYGNANAAYSFDGMDDRIDSLNIPLNGSSDWTIATWLKFNPYNNNFQSIISNYENNFEIGVVNAQSQLSIYSNNGTIVSVNNGARINRNDFLVFQKAGNQLRIFRNDTLLVQNNNGSGLNFTSLKRIGLWNPNSSDPNQKQNLNAIIHDILIYQRALTVEEMKQLYLLNKSANSIITAKDSSLTFEPTMTGLTSSITTHVSNTTCDTILIDSIYTTNTVFSTNLNIPYLLPYQSKEFTVTFSPYAAVPFAGQLIIRSNGVDTVTIALSGNGCALCACPTQDVVINTQTQLNDFVAQYGGCDTIPVNMSILGDASLTNMAGLQFIKRIEGNLHIINNQAITSMNGWQNLAGLAGELRIENNSQLVSLDSLVDLTAIGGQLSIKNNNALTSLNGLQNLLSVGDNLTITNNAALANCSAICNLINSTSVPPTGGQGVGGGITITGNPSECSSLNEVTIRCAPSCLTGNIVLTSQAEVNAFVAKGNMLSCNPLVGNLTISGANINSLAGMTFLKTITGNLTIQNNTILPTINGLDSLRKVGNTLTIGGNGTLTHINGLLRLDTIGLDLTIQNNAALTQVGGLAQVDRVGRNLNVSSNNSLGDCAGLCYLIQTPASVGGSRTVTNNPSPCSSITEVRIKCNENDCPNQDYILTTQVEVNTFIASFNDCDSIIGNLTIEGGNSINNISGLSFITYIGGSLTIRNNNLITTLAGFNNLQKVNWALRIENNAGLTNMTQLKKLKHIGNELRLVNNDAMIVLTGLDSINFIGNNFTLTQNNILVDASQICRLINQNVVKGSYNINNNPSPVSSVNEVTAICIYGSQVTKVLIQNLQDTIEEGSVLTFNVALDYPPNDTVTVSLVSSNQVEVPLPATVKILPGTISRQVSVLLPNNNVPEKDKSVNITAGAPYLTSATGQLVLTDHDDVPPIELIITQSEVAEGAGLYATSAKVRRLGALGNILNVTLQSSEPGQVTLPTGVNILANETEKTFFIGVLDNALADGNRMNTITATVIINSCVCPAPAGTNGVSSRSFTILDNDGPALTLAINPLSMPEGKINAGTLTITRNTPTNVALTVSLISSDTTEIVLPATATIPINATSVNIPVRTKSDVQEDGNQEVNIIANHPGFTNGVIWAIVTDINKPDLVIPSAEALEDTIALEEILPFKVYIHNKGLTASTRGVSLIGYLSSDASISSDDHVIGQYFLDISIPAGDTIVYGGIGSIPQRIGNFNLLFKINPNESITELLYLNNTSPAVPVTIVPNYTGTAIVDSTVFLIGAPIVIYGSSYNSQGAKIGNVNLDIYLIRDGIRRTIAIKTNAQGDYSYTFNPLQSDFGHFIVGACYPGFNITEQQDAFDILGLTINNGNFLTWDMVLGDTISSGISLRNVTNIPMSNVTMTPVSLPNGCSLVFNTIANFPANTTLSLGYQIVAGAVTAPGVYQQFPIAIKSNTTTLQQVTGYYHCKAAQGLLVASVTNIVQNINKDQSQIVEFTITNRGQGSTGAITISVPNANWVRLVSPASIAALAPNQSATITVEFIPTSALPLNTPATGNIAINSSSANGVSVPFTITKVSDVTGSILIDVINQFTYFTPEAPHLEEARVRISNYFTGQVYADGLSNTSGIFNAGNLPEGQLRIVVDAERHKSHDGVIDIAPGSNGTKVIFLEYKAISFSWDVQPTTIEDEYEIDLIMNFEANVPVPVIVMSMPDTLPRLNANETFSFYINMTNKGLITAKEVKLDLPIDPEYELLTTYQSQDILAQQTIQVPVLMKRRVASGNINGGNGSQNRIKVNDDVIKKAEQRLNFIKN